MNLPLISLLLALTASAPNQLQQRVEQLVLEVEPRVADVPVTSARQLLQAHPMPILLDVRSPAERAVSIIPGAITEIGQLPRGTRIVVYCTVGLRSGLRTRELRAQGLEAVNLRGGILSWLAEGGTLVDPQGKPTAAVHVYGKRWNAVPEAINAVWKPKP